MKRKLSLIIALVLLTAFALTSCARYEPNTVLYVYNWGEYIDPTVNEQFEREYGIKVVYDEYDNNESMYATLKNNAAQYDVVFPSDYMVARLIAEDMLEPINFENVPNYSLIMDKFKGLDYDPECKYSVAYTWGVIGLLYNTKYVNDTPDSWSDLWDDDYAGKVLMYNNSRDSIGLSLIKNGYSVNTEDKSQLEQSAHDVLELKRNCQAFVSDEIFNLMESGSAYMTPAYGGDALAMIEENPDLDYVIPNEGTNMYIDAMCIVKGSKNKEAAEKYINFMCRTDIAELNRAETCYSTPHQEVFDQLESEIKDELLAYPPDEILDKTQVYSHLSQQSLDYYTKLWLKIKNSL